LNILHKTVSSNSTLLFHIYLKKEFTSSWFGSTTQKLPTFLKCWLFLKVCLQSISNKNDWQRNIPESHAQRGTVFAGGYCWHSLRSVKRTTVTRKPKGNTWSLWLHYVPIIRPNNFQEIQTNKFLKVYPKCFSSPTVESPREHAMDSWVLPGVWFRISWRWKRICILNKFPRVAHMLLENHTAKEKRHELFGILNLITTFSYLIISSKVKWGL
jgi:hypothetical protein